MKKALWVILIALLGLLLFFWLFTGGLYAEEDTIEPDTLRVAGPVLTRRQSDGGLDFRAFILICPSPSASFGRMRIVTPFSDDYPFRSSELLYYDLFARRIVLSSLAYDEGVTETVYSRGGAKTAGTPSVTEPGAQDGPSARIAGFKSIVIDDYISDIAEDGRVEILRTDGGVRVSYYFGVPDEDGTVAREECLESRVEGGAELYEKILALANECGLADWNGFHASNDDVLDGGGFSFRAVFDGETVRASGSNAYPDGYGAFTNAIHRLLREGE